MLKQEQITGGTNKLLVTERQLKHFKDAKQSKTGIRLNLSTGVIKYIAKTGGIFSLLAAVPALIAAAAPAVEKQLRWALLELLLE